MTKKIRPKPLSLLSRQAQKLYLEINEAGSEGVLWGGLPRTASRELLANGHLKRLGATCWTTESFNKLASDKPPKEIA